MKKSIMVLLFASVTMVSFGQIQVYNVNTTPRTSIGKLKSGMAFVAEIQSEFDGKDTTYFLSFNDAQYDHITSIETLTFNSIGNSFDIFYEICKSVFKEENKKNKEYSVTFKLGDKTVTVWNNRMLGTACVRIMIGKSYTAPLIESQIDKLFGKS